MNAELGLLKYKMETLEEKIWIHINKMGTQVKDFNAIPLLLLTMKTSWSGLKLIVHSILLHLQATTTFSPENFRIIDVASDGFSLSIKEAIHIKKHNPILNKQLSHDGSNFLCKLLWFIDVDDLLVISYHFIKSPPLSLISFCSRWCVPLLNWPDDDIVIETYIRRQ